MSLPKTIVLDGTTYETEQFSQGVQQAISIYNSITEDLQKEQLAVVKTQAALQQIGAQIGAAIKRELEAGEQAAPAPSEPGGPVFGPTPTPAEPTPSEPGGPVFGPGPQPTEPAPSEPGGPVFGPGPQPTEPTPPEQNPGGPVFGPSN